MTSKLAWGAFGGLVAWLAYATVEFAAAAIAPLVAYSGMTIADWYWKLTLLLLAVYAAAGLLLGALAGLLPSGGDHPEEKHPRRYLVTGALTVAAAFVVNTATGSREPACLTVGIGVTAMLLLAVRSKLWRERLSLVANPWGTAVLLLAAARWGSEMLRQQGPVVRCAAVIVALLAFAGLSILKDRILRPRAGSPLRQAAAIAAGMLAVFGCALLLDHPGARVRAASKPSGPSRPNIVLISLDTVRADHLSLYGYSRKTTPRLEALAQSSTLYRHAQAAGDMTLPSHAAMFTGTYASWNGAHPGLNEHANAMAEQYRTLPEILSANGYATLAVVANTAFLQPAFGFDRGFESFDSRSPLLLLPPDKPYYLRQGVRRFLHQFTATEEFDMNVRRASEINEVAYQALARVRGEGRPFFLFVNYMDAHSPYVPPAPFDAMYPGKDRTVTYARRLAWGAEVASLRGKLTGPQRDHLISQYDGAIAYMDAQIGDLIRHLQQAGVYENTLIAVTGDHGEAFGERGFMGHGESVYQDEVSVPLLIRYPRGQKQVVESLAGHVDILPTILASAGIPAPVFVQGRNLLDGATPADRFLVSESFPEPRLMDLHKRFIRTERALYSGKYKLIASTAGKRELYNIANDPAEQSDLCGGETSRCVEMAGTLEAWLKSAPRPVATKKTLDGESIKRLKGLGYVK